VHLYQAGRWAQIAAFPRPALDPTGAGDVFAAAFLLEWSRTGDPHTAARFANAAASFIVEVPDASWFPTRAEIMQRIRQDGR
jgi:sugar/nucleoside kinase (ribokinase family)